MAVVPLPPGMAKISIADPPPAPVATKIPRKNFLRMLLAGSAALACPGVVLIAWEHEHVPSIANLVLSNTNTVPQAWPGTRFNIVWIFDFNPGTNTHSFH